MLVSENFEYLLNIFDTDAMSVLEVIQNKKSKHVEIRLADLVTHNVAFVAFQEPEKLRKLIEVLSEALKKMEEKEDDESEVPLLQDDF